MLKEIAIFATGALLGGGLLLSFFLLPVWLHGRTRRKAMRARMDGIPERWLN